MHCASTKDAWDKFKNIYEGVEKVKKAKLQTYSRLYEYLSMNKMSPHTSFELMSKVMPSRVLE